MEGQGEGIEMSVHFQGVTTEMMKRFPGISECSLP